MNWKLAIVLGLFFTAIGFLGIICWQIYEVPQRHAPFFSLEAIWPAKAAWWAKVGMWGSVLLFGFFFRRWKRKDSANGNP